MLAEHFKLGPLQVIAILLIVVTFVVDVLGNVLDLAAALLHGRVQLHRVVSRVLQRLLQVRDLSGKLALRSYQKLGGKATYICLPHSSSAPWAGT